MLLVVAVTAIGAGCRSGEVALESAPSEVSESRYVDVLPELVRYGNRVRALDSRELAEQYRSLAFGDAFWSDDAAIRLSLLLSAPNSPYHDIDQATRFLRDVIERDPAGRSDRAHFAMLLHHLLNERVYATAEDEALAGLLADARDRAESLEEELEAVKSELDTERARRKTLEEQLDALRRLEEQLSLDAVGRP